MLTLASGNVVPGSPRFGHFLLLPLLQLHLLLLQPLVLPLLPLYLLLRRPQGGPLLLFLLRILRTPQWHVGWMCVVSVDVR